jgi:two-component system phosphate regulon response regulator PhoB
MTSLSRRTILVAEDNEDIRSLLRFFLEENGYEVIEARNGAEAVKMAQTTKPDLILMDLTMPYVSGIDAAIKIRSFNELRHIPIVANSGDGTRGIELFNNAKKLGSAYISYITKPFYLNELTEHINTGLLKSAEAA